MGIGIRVILMGMSRYSIGRLGHVRKYPVDERDCESAINIIANNADYTSASEYYALAV